jgi:hypothetical protein
MWREAMMELLDQLEAENPEDASLAPKACASADRVHGPQSAARIRQALAAPQPRRHHHA